MPDKEPVIVEESPEVQEADEAKEVEEEHVLDQMLLQLDSDEDEVGVKDVDAPDAPNIEPGVSDPEKEQTTEPSEAPEGAKPDTGDADTTEGKDGLEKALSALHRAKVPKSVLDNLSDEEALTWGSDLAKIQADTDEAFRAKAELEKQVSGDDIESQDEESAADAEPADQPSEANLDNALVDFADTFGEDAAKTLQNFVTPQIKQQEQAIMATLSMVEGVLLRDARIRLEERFPQLAEQDRFDMVSEKAKELIPNGNYDMGDVHYEALQDAARIVFSDENVDTRSRIRDTNNKKRIHGQMSKPSGAAPAESMTVEDRESMVLDMLESGVSPEEAQRQAGW